ncbi:transmembrane emp24 domain-containing protein p24delta10 [Canna indica]|uniref:Transmembrane emp24 domain-containing protein p24delta10 n=1 Tax=Canna indica TaxID=4628 RepID=A0AAQ3KQ07_9LILI|nr:transmembrane emp24 domain-containing protein p24delta10 [Canna indica]
MRSSSSPRPLLLPLLVVFLSSTRPSQALVFHLSSGSVKCFSEELRAEAMSVAHFRVADEPPSGRNVSASVMDPNGENLRRADGVESGEFAFVAENAGKYTTCFWSPHFQLQVTVTVDFEWKTGIAAKDWTSFAEKGNIDEMELQLKKLEDTINSIHEEMIYLREREEEARNLNVTTASRMGSFSIMSFFVCMGVACLQLWHLKAFFERKKIL